MKSAKGFSIVELLITVFIISLISTVILAGYSRFSSRLALSRTAQEVALALRRAQTYSLAVKGFDPDGAGPASSLFRGWGVHFNPALNSQRKFIIYADVPPSENKLYDGDNNCALGSECYEVLLIQTSSKITDLCAGLETAAADECGLTRVDVTFQRPNPSMTLKVNGTSNYSDIEIILSAPDGTKKQVVIWDTGRISIENI